MAKVKAPPGMQYVKNPSGKGWTLKPKPGAKPKGPKPLTPAQQLAERQRQQKANEEYAKAQSAFASGPLTAYLTDPIYQRDRADLDLDFNNARNQFEQAMGVNGAKGSIWQDYDFAINALNRGTKKNISGVNAGLSGSNLAGSGIARKQLSDVEADYRQRKSEEDLGKERLESAANELWASHKTRFDSANLGAQGEAGTRWSAMNDAPEAPAHKAVAKPGHQFVKKPGGGFTQQAKPKDPRGAAFNRAPVPAKKTAPPGMKYVKIPGSNPVKYKLQKV